MQTMFPFEKNRYFPYKRMRSEDFCRELQYMDHKFQYLNRFAFGAGIAFGLKPQRLDAEVLMVSPGMAVDRQGRYLIVDEPAVCRLRTLTGFETLSGNTALLWLRYREEPRGPMTVTRDEGEQEEFSYAAERFEFALTELGTEPLDTVDRVLYFDRELCATDVIRVRQIMPDVLSSRQPVKLRLIFENLSQDKLTAQLHYAPSLPGFHTEGSDGIVCDRALELPRGETVVELTLIPETAAQTVCFTADVDDFSLQLPGRELSLNGSIRQKLYVESGDPVEKLAERLQTRTPQELWGEEEDRGIPVAALQLVRYEENVLLEHVSPLYEQQRAHLPALEQRLAACREFFPVAAVQAPVIPMQPVPEPAPEVPEVRRSLWDQYMTTGVVVLNAGLHLRKGKVLCTGEIPHNLGPGTVYVDFGIEKVHPAGEEAEPSGNIILGDASLFIPEEDDYEHNFDRGVCIHPDKGTFELSLRLKGELHESTLQLRWYAWRPERCSSAPVSEAVLMRPEPEVRTVWDQSMATGVVSLSVGLHTQKGEVLSTGELFHSLGAGPVYMDFGIECVRPAEDAQRNIRTIVLGDSSLFNRMDDDYERDFDRGICIHPEKGTFELSLRVRGEIHASSLQLRWYAWRMEQAAADSGAEGELLRVEPSVVYAKPGQEIWFSPIFRGNGMPCEFFVEERQSGLITEDGVYTAPEQDGLYQICAQVQGRPETRVSAFIIVRSQEEGAEDDSAEV